MKRYALPLIIFGIIAALIGLIVFGGSSAPDYSGGKPVVQPVVQEWVRGNNQAANVLIEYSDFQCPACRAYQPLLEKVMSVYGSQIALVFRNFPLYQIHVNADPAARAAEAAGLQGKFWEMHDLLFNNQEEWSKKPNPWSTFDAYAAVLGLDGQRFKVDVASDAVSQSVADDYARGTAQGVRGTPSFFLNGTKISPSRYEDFAAILDAVLGIKK